MAAGMTTRSQPRSAALPTRRLYQGAVLLFVATLHVLAVRLLPWAAPTLEHAPPMSLTCVLLPPVVEPPDTPPPTQARTRTSTPTRAPTKAVAATPNIQPAATTPTSALRAVTITDRDDAWAPASTGETSDGIRFERRSPLASFSPLPPSLPTRFRLRDDAGLAGVLRAVAQFLLWPPGYSDDPCEGLAEAADALREMSGEGRRALLEDVARKQGQYCN